MSRHDTGAASELTAAADLMRRGFQIYRAESPHAPFDLVAIRESMLLRVEVRTAMERPDGTLMPNVKVTDDCDVYAFVCGSRVEYANAVDVLRARFPSDPSEQRVTGFRYPTLAL